MHGGDEVHAVADDDAEVNVRLAEHGDGEVHAADELHVADGDDEWHAVISDPYMQELEPQLELYITCISTCYVQLQLGTKS